jgi:hypothetical protein
VDLAVPPLTTRVALDVLGDLLRGSDPSSIAAREAILSTTTTTTTTACRSFESFLEMGSTRAEGLLQANPVSNVDLLAFECSCIGKVLTILNPFTDVRTLRFGEGNNVDPHVVRSLWSLRSS